MGNVELSRDSERDAVCGLTRTRFVPIVETGEGSGVVSKLGGAAWLRAGEKWPTCRSCSRPMHLLVQLRAEDVPGDMITIPGKSILQVFHCGTGSCDHGEVTRSPGGTGVRLRIVPTMGGKQTAAPKGSVLGHRIVDFTSADEELPDAADAGTKLGGWPMWIQHPSRPACATCDLPMRFALQLQSEHHIGVGSGDAGLAYLHQCPKHPMQLAFSWSST